MNRDKLLEELKDLFEDSNITLDTPLDEIEAWDSMGMISFISVIDEILGKEIDPDMFDECSNIDDLINLALA